MTRFEWFMIGAFIGQLFSAAMGINDSNKVVLGVFTFGVWLASVLARKNGSEGP